MSQFTEEEYFYKADNLIRTSVQALISLFLGRWENATGSPWNETESPNEFISGIGKIWLKSAKPIQKKNFYAGIPQIWDVTLVSQLLQQFPPKPNATEEETRQTENTAIYNLTQLRNQLAHKGQGKLSQAEFAEFEDKFRKSIQALGVMTEAQLDRLVLNAGVTSSVTASEIAKKIQCDAVKAEEEGKLEEAVKLYEDALGVPSLLPISLASIYEQRAGCYLKLAKGTDACCEQAKKDAEEALEYNENSWRGHLIMGKVLRRTYDLKKALQHLNRALAIAPGKVEVRQELNSCKLLAVQIDRMEHLDPASHPISQTEFVDQIRAATGVPMTEELFLELLERTHESIPGKVHVDKGHQYLMGWGVPQNPREAAICYAKSMKQDNAEGIFNLGILHRDGKGVKQDFDYALKLFHRAAKLPPKIKVVDFTIPDVGVIKAQHTLGLMYQDGVGVTKDLQLALKWYSTAVENGSGPAANNLGLMYSNGEGTVRDLKMAEFYWKIAVEHKCMEAAYSLCRYYANQLEPKLAREMLEKSVSFGNDKLVCLLDEVDVLLKEKEAERAKFEEKVVAFETSNQLTTEGLTFMERLEQILSSRLPAIGRHLEAIKNSQDVPSTKTTDGYLDAELHQQLLQRVSEGSVTAERFLRTIRNTLNFLNLWTDKTPPFSKEDEETLVNLLYACISVETHAVKIPGIMFEDICSFVKELLGREDLEGDMDMKLRLLFAYCTFAKGGVDDTLLEILKEGLRRYPNEVHFYHNLSTFNGHLGRFEEALKFADEGLLKFPRNFELLYDRATVLRLLQGNQSDIREGYQKFLDQAPEDHRMVPEAYYCIAATYVGVEDEVEKIKHYFGRGVKAERLQLKCYLPYDSASKFILEPYLEIVEAPTASSSKAGSHLEKARLEHPFRAFLIRHHRELLQQMFEMSPTEKTKPDFSTQPPKLVHKLPKAITDLKTIALKEMDVKKDHIYENRILSLRLIEEPVIRLTSVQTVAQDENQDLVRLFVHNLQNEDIDTTLGFGCTISVINPYLNGLTDETQIHTFGIRVDDPKCIIYNVRLTSPCRYCLEEGASHSCSKCEWAKYCSAECEIADSERFGHELICTLGTSSLS